VYTILAPYIPASDLQQSWRSESARAGSVPDLLWLFGYPQGSNGDGSHDDVLTHKDVLRVRTTTDCPCLDELERCKKCIADAMREDTPKKRNFAKSKCTRGPCGEYLRCITEYEMKLTPGELKAFRLKCPRFDWSLERTTPQYCCVQIRCRGMRARIPYLGITLGEWEEIVAHCVAVKISCDGSREVWEVTPTEPTPPAKRLRPAITKHTGSYMSGPRRVHGDPFTVAEGCWECNPDDRLDVTDPPGCAKLNDEFVKKYPGGGAYDATGDNCNSFAGWVEAQILGTRTLGCKGAPYYGGGRYQ